MIEEIRLKGKTCYITGVRENYEKLFLWPAGRQEDTERVFEELSPVLKEQKCLLAACEIEDWNGELSPWEAAAVFGKEGFSGQGAETLEWLVQDCIGHFQKDLPEGDGSVSILIGGYSLAGLFALWAFEETGLFRGAASCSGSLWFPGFTEYLRKREKDGVGREEKRSLYFSLGEREAKNKNPVLSTIKACTEEVYGYYSDRPDRKTKLEWNPGGHFTEPGNRLIKGFRWLLEHTV